MSFKHNSPGSFAEWRMRNRDLLGLKAPRVGWWLAAVLTVQLIRNIHSSASAHLHRPILIDIRRAPAPGVDYLHVSCWSGRILRTSKPSRLLSLLLDAHQNQKVRLDFCGFHILVIVNRGTKPALS